jgi:hypothetical protein
MDGFSNFVNRHLRSKRKALSQMVAETQTKREAA